MKKVGDGTRILNFMIDTLIIFAVAYFSFKGWKWYVVYWGYPYYNFGWFFFGFLFVYYTFFEGVFGRSPGKWASYSKVVDVDGRKPAFWRVLVRSLTRIVIIDMFFIPFLGGTLHDYISGTMVVEA